MDWFEAVTGFREEGYDQTRAKLAVEGHRLRSLVNGKTYGIGELELVPLKGLRDRARSGATRPGRPKVEVITGDVRAMHRSPENAGALFQVASQFNLLEMVSPAVTPEDGVTRYQHDATQGPACAIAAGAATIYRNYFVPVCGGHGQTRARQLDGLADLGSSLSAALKRPVEHLWTMQNGYALCSSMALGAIAGHLATCSLQQLDTLRGELCVGLHRDVEVTDGGSGGPRVSQVFCSALPVAYGALPRPQWDAFASLVLQAAYEATMWCAALNAQRGVSDVVLLTALGGGAFGNDERWIYAAMRRSLEITAGFELRVKLVSHGVPSQAMSQIAADFR